MKRLIVAILAVFLASGTSLVAQQGREPENTFQPPAQITADSDEVSKVRFAGAQHEIIVILMNQGQFQRIPSEFEKIAVLDFAPENEDLLVAEVWTILENLRTLGRHDVALDVIDIALENVSENESRYNLWMFKGKALKDAGRTDEAIDAFRQAQQYRN